MQCRSVHDIKSGMGPDTPYDLAKKQMELMVFGHFFIDVLQTGAKKHFYQKRKVHMYLQTVCNPNNQVKETMVINF